MAAIDQAAASGVGLAGRARDISPAQGPGLRNETARKVIIEGDDIELVLPPFAETTLSTHEAERLDLHTLRRSAHLAVVKRTSQSPERDVSAALALPGLLVFAVPIWALVGIFVGSPRYWTIGAGVAAAMIIVPLIWWKVSRTKREAPDRIPAWLARSKGWATQQMYLATSVLIGLVAPTAVILFAGELLEVIDTMRFAAPGVDLHSEVLTMVGRWLQLVFIAAVSLLPALLFFLFDREQLATLRHRFMRQIVRLDPTVETRVDIKAKYGPAMDEAYGHEHADEGRLLPGRRSPVLVATFIITLGWILTLAHVDAGRIDNEAELLQLFQPAREPVVYAFLGAYTYALGMVLRGYVRKDLRPKSYSHITVRTILVVVLAWVLQLQWTGDVLLGLVFVAGLVPETVIVLIKEWLRAATALPLVEEEPDPLTRLEGIDLYDRTRLLDEGVTSVEGLAHHDLVELILQTRVHAAQLVDWVDQAILYLHAGPSDKTGDPMSRTETLRVLRAYGIRTATDLVTAFDADAARQGEEAYRDAGQLSRVLAKPPVGADGAPSRIQVICDVIRDEEWVTNLLRWHSEDAVHPTPITVHAGSTLSLLDEGDPVGAAAG